MSTQYLEAATTSDFEVIRVAASLICDQSDQVSVEAAQ